MVTVFRFSMVARWLRRGGRNYRQLRQVVSICAEPARAPEGWSGLAVAASEHYLPLQGRGAPVPTVVLFKKFDPWHPRDHTGFNKTGYVTENGVVIYPRRSRIARTSLDAIRKRPHRIIPLTNHPRAKEIETFFTKNVINNIMYTTAMQLIGQPASPFWDDPIKLPILNPITAAEHATQMGYISKHVTAGRCDLHTRHKKHQQSADNSFGSRHMEPCRHVHRSGPHM